MKVMEVLAQPTNWRWTSKTDYDFSAEFEIGGLEYNVEFDFNQDRSIVQVEFEVFDEEEFAPKTQITGTGNAFLVFATIIDIMKDFISQLEQTTKMVFLVDISEPSRIVLYNRMIKTLSKPNNIVFNGTENVGGEVLAYDLDIIK